MADASEADQLVLQYICNFHEAPRGDLRVLRHVQLLEDLHRGLRGAAKLYVTFHAGSSAEEFKARSHQSPRWIEEFRCPFALAPGVDSPPVMNSRWVEADTEFVMENGSIGGPGAAWVRFSDITKGTHKEILGVMHRLYGDRTHTAPAIQHLEVRKLGATGIAVMYVRATGLGE